VEQNGVLDKVTAKQLKAAASRFHHGKMDIGKGYSSDSILHAPDILFERLAVLFRFWMTHKYISPQLLSCALLPLRKGLKDPSLVKNYRAISSTSILFRLLENVILTVWGSKIKQHNLQFGFRRKMSTTQCTWLAMETVRKYLREGSTPWVVAMDCSMAFDCCKWPKLFTELLKYLPAVVVRIILVAYRGQSVWVTWGNTVSSLFSVNNGLGQGRVLAPLLWSAYVLPLLEDLEELGVGCHFGDVFAGVLGFADDLLLLLPNRTAGVLMLRKCEEWATKYGITFSTDPNPTKSKTKVMVVKGNQKLSTKPANLELYDIKLPFVSHLTHLGNELHEDGNMNLDTKMKRSQYIQKSMEIADNFNFAYPREKLKVIKKEAGQLYGCTTWDLSGEEFRKTKNCWRTTVKDIYNVPRQTKRYIVDHLLSEETSIESDVITSYVKFVKTLLDSPSRSVSLVAETCRTDTRSILGTNITYLEELLDLDMLSSSRMLIREKVAGLVTVPDGGEKTLNYLAELIGDRIQLEYGDHQNGIDGETQEDEDIKFINEIISALCQD
jgi:hypothetical protein